MLSKRNFLFVLLIFSSVLLLFNSGRRSFWEPDEGRYAEISREMVESGDWLTPRLNYIKHFDKPPVTYWLIGSSFKAFGQNEFAGHLPLVLFGLTGILATFALGKRLFGQRSGALSAIILASSLGYPAMSRVLSTDIIFSLFCLLCYLFFAQKKYLLFHLFMALGFMTKGPVVFVITLIPICIFLIYEKDTATFKQMRWGQGMLLFALIAFPWFIYQIRLNKGLLYDWLFHQTLGRIVREIQQPFYFFIPVLIGLFFPWIFFLISALKRKLSFKKAPLDEEHTKILLLFLWFILPFIFFSCIGKKLVPYILPLLPPLATITARFWDEIIDNPKMLAGKIFAVPYYIFLFCLGALFVSVMVFSTGGFDDQLKAQLAPVNIIALVAILAAAMIATFSLFKLKRGQALFCAITLTSALFFLAAIDILPKIEIYTSKSIRTLAMKINKDLRPEDKIVNYRCFLKSLPFYLGRRTIVVERERNLAYEESQHWQDYLLKDKEDFYQLLSAKDFRVFCITYTWEFKKIREEYSRPLYFLGQAGKYVLFVNRVKHKFDP